MAVMTTYPSRSSAVGSQTRRFFNFRCSTQMSSDLVTDGNAAVENPAGRWFDEKAPRSSVWCASRGLGHRGLIRIRRGPETCSRVEMLLPSAAGDT